jgi:hypothetical protein
VQRGSLTGELRRDINVFTFCLCQSLRRSLKIALAERYTAVRNPALKELVGRLILDVFDALRSHPDGDAATEQRVRREIFALRKRF